VPGEGQIDHAEMFHTLFTGGFEGPLYVERIDGTENAARMAAEVIDERLERARRLMAALLEKETA
jgi:sugar phosphate isomerase/epimerase